jgi:hypothetical protein
LCFGTLGLVKIGMSIICSEGKNSKLNKKIKNEKFSQILLFLQFLGSVLFLAVENIFL